MGAGGATNHQEVVTVKIFKFGTGKQRKFSKIPENKSISSTQKIDGACPSTKKAEFPPLSGRLYCFSKTSAGKIFPRNSKNCSLGYVHANLQSIEFTF